MKGNPLILLATEFMYSDINMCFKEENVHHTLSKEDNQQQLLPDTDDVDVD
jgi:hypothetical protein